MREVYSRFKAPQGRCFCKWAELFFEADPIDQEFGGKILSQRVNKTHPPFRNGPSHSPLVLVFPPVAYFSLATDDDDKTIGALAV